MSESKATPGPTDRYTRRKTRHRGISYRLRADGSRSYSVYIRGTYRPVVGGEREALALQAELRGKVARGERIRPSTATFAAVAEEWFASKRKLRPWTRKSYRDSLDRIILPQFEDRKIAAISADDVARLIRELEAKGLSASTIENYLVPLSGTFSFAVRRGLLNVNPCSLLTSDDRPQRRARQQDHVWSEEEIHSLIEAAEQLARQPASRYDYSPPIRIALYTGLRLGELLGLQWQDIDLEESVLHVHRQWTRTGEYAEPKTKAGVRRIPLSSELVSFLTALKLRSHHSRDDHPVFAARNGEPLTHRNVTRRGFEAAAKKAGIDGVSFHSMRHAFASRMIDRGLASTVLARLMGHESSAITERRYIHIFDRQRTDEAVRAAMAASSH